MRSLLPRILLATLATTACSSQQAADLAVDEPAAHRLTSADEAPQPPEEQDHSEGGGAETAMALDEGKLGKADGQPAEGQYKMQGNADIRSGLDDRNVDGELARQQAIEQARQAGVLGASGTGTGNGYGMGGTIGTGRYGTIGHGAGTGAGYGRGGSRGRAAFDAATSEGYKDYGTNAWTAAANDRLSTFAVDVDTASYTITRRKLTEGTLPPPAAVRVEELVNYFGYAYPAPDGERPFSVTTDMAPSPFGAKRHILRVGVSSKPIAPALRQPANLVFLVDISGSMNQPDKLPLAQRSLRVLVENLDEKDTVALVTYAGATRVVLPPTGLADKARILAAIEDLRAGGSTAMGDGITLAYEQAAKGLRPDAISRVIVLSDGDANVGRTTHDAILATIRGKVKEGVTLSTIGFGMGNYKDELMEQLANKGNGNNFYIDGISAAKRVFQQQLGATLDVVAKDVKLQVDFDATRVARYRLIGYENRDVRDVDFRNDKVDAGEIGAGHQVTALYEVELADGHAASTQPIVTVRVRHKAPRGERATEAAFAMAPAALLPAFRMASTDFRFAFAVAAFADVLRGGEDAQRWELEAIRAIANDAAGTDADRRELVQLIDRAITLRGRTARIP